MRLASYSSVAAPGSIVITRPAGGSDPAAIFVINFVAGQLGEIGRGVEVDHAVAHSVLKIAQPPRIASRIAVFWHRRHHNCSRAYPPGLWILPDWGRFICFQVIQRPSSVPDTLFSRARRLLSSGIKCCNIYCRRVLAYAYRTQRTQPRFLVVLAFPMAWREIR
jgi:hypothetical protein